VDRLFAAIVICLWGAFASSASEAATRVAVISNHSDAAVDDLLSLAEALVSDDDSVQLVERTEINRVLGEHELSLSGLVDAKQAIQVGSLVGADVLAVVETEPQSRGALGMLAFETTTGLHLWNVSLSEQDLEKAAEQIADGIRQAVSKRQRDKSQLRSICLVSTRNADLPASANSFCDGVRRLVERILTNAPQMMVLERTRFGLIKKELALDILGEDQRKLDLLAALVTMDLQFSRGDGDEVVATATLYNSDGESIGKTSAKYDYMDALALSDRMGERIAELLKTGKSEGIVNPKQEASRFRREAVTLYRHDQLDRATTSLEAALALDRHDAELLDVAAKISFYSASEILEPYRFHLTPRMIHVTTDKANKALVVAERGLDYLEELYRQKAERDLPALTAYQSTVRNPDGSYRAEECHDSLHFLELFMQRAMMVDSRQRSLPRERMQERFRDLHLKWINPRAYKAVRDHDSFVQYTNYLGVLLRNVELYSDTGKTWADETSRLLDAWLTLVDQHGVYHNEWFAINAMFAAISNHQGQLDRVGAVGHWVLQPTDIGSLRATYERMTKQSNSALQMMGKAGLFWCEIVRRQPLQSERQKLFEELYQATTLAIEQSSKPEEAAARVLCYYTLLDAVDWLAPTSARQQQVQRLFDFAIARGELVYGLAMAACNPAHVRYQYYAPYIYHALGRRNGYNVAIEEYPRLAANARRVLELARSNPQAAIDDKLARTRFELTNILETIYLEKPELREGQGTPWKKVRRLISVTDYPDLRAISRVVVRGDQIFALGIGNSDYRPNGFLQLIQVDRKTGKRTASDDIYYARGPSPPLIPRYSANSHFDIHGGKAYVGTFYSGILVKPLANEPTGKGEVADSQAADSSEPRWIGRGRFATDSGKLPSDRVFSLAIQDDKLFASVGAFSGQGSFLVSVDLKDDTVRTITSSRRNDRQTPLDGLATPPLVFLPMVKDPARHRLLFVVSYPLSHCGVWELNTRTEKIRRLTSYDHYVQWISGNRDGKVWLGLSNKDYSEWSAIELDLASDQQRLVYTTVTEGDLSGLEPDANTHLAADWPAQPPYVRVDDTIWSAWPFGMVPSESAAERIFPPLESRTNLLRQLRGLRHEFNWRGMEPLENGEILISNRHGVWVVER